MDCCKNELGNFPHNADIPTGIMVLGGGDYVFNAGKINGTVFAFPVTIPDVDTPTELVIPKGILNEDFYYCFTVKNPAGNFVETNDCQNYCLKTYIETNTTCGNTCPPEEEPIL